MWAGGPVFILAWQLSAHVQLSSEYQAVNTISFFLLSRKFELVVNF